MVRGVFGSLLLSVASGSKCPSSFTPVCQNLDVSRYAGVWYEQVNSKSFTIDNDLKCVTAEYTAQDDGTVKVDNKGAKGSRTGEITDAVGTAKVKDLAKCELGVKFSALQPVDAPYTIFDTDYDSYSVVVSCIPVGNALGLSDIWILSRTPKLDQNVLNGLLQKLADAGFDYGDMRMQEQESDCNYDVPSSLQVSDTCSLYQIADGTCGQSDLNCDYVKYAKAAEKGLQDGTCADQGYTVQTGTQTKTYPIIGDIKITTYTKGSLALASSGPALVTFDGAAGTTFKFTALDDPVMGGKSTGTWTLGNGFGTLDGEVVDVPSLSAPGFIKAAADGKFPDISSAFGGNLVLNVRTSTPEYAGYRVTFVSGATSGSFACAAGGSLPFSRGCFKAKFSVPAGDNFGQIKIPFTDFSDKWSSATGEQTTTCAESADVCPTASKLSKITRVEFWGEGANGKLHLDVQSVMAEDASGNLIQMV